MRSSEMIEYALTLSRDWTSMVATDLADAAMTSPTPAGGNHPTWVIGHCAFSERELLSMITGEPNPLKSWEAVFSAGTTPSADTSKYPKYAEIVAAFDAARAKTIEHLSGLNETDLDRMPAAIHPELAEMPMFSSVGRMLMFIVVHQMAHFGQLTDARRALGRPALMR